MRVARLQLWSGRCSRPSSAQGNRLLIAAIARWLYECLSLLSCLVNVIRGGERELTFSAESWYIANFCPVESEAAAARKKVEFIDRIFRALGEEDHCKAAWNYWTEFSAIKLRSAGWTVSPPDDRSK